MADPKSLLEEAKKGMQRSLEHLEVELQKIRAGKASPSMVDHLKIDYYGTLTPIGQVATITAADARTITVQPFERQHMTPIERAIKEANLGINPQNDGIIIRLALPVLTEDRRKQLVKQAKEQVETAKVAIRNVRRDLLDRMKKLTKEGVAEDAVKAGEGDMQKLTDSFINQVDQLLGHKETEIMTV